MKKHYAFIPLCDQDVRDFKNLLIGDLWFRPVASLLAMTILVQIGITKRFVLLENGPVFIVYVLAFLLILYLICLESGRLLYIRKLQKKNLLPYIRTIRPDSAFYTEELENGFIVQTEPVKPEDIMHCKKILSDIRKAFSESFRLVYYLLACLDSGSLPLMNKAVIYTEILKEQLDQGNLSILDSYDRIRNYKGEEMP